VAQEEKGLAIDENALTRFLTLTLNVQRCVELSNSAKFNADSTSSSSKTRVTIIRCSLSIAVGILLTALPFIKSHLVACNAYEHKTRSTSPDLFICSLLSVRILNL